MKKILLCFVLVVTPLYFSTVMEPTMIHAEEPYAKWGRLAVEKTQEKYPNAKLKDYKHIGRMHGTNTTLEKFKLWLTEGNREFGVLVNIEFDTKTEKVIDITFKEVKS